MGITKDQVQVFLDSLQPNGPVDEDTRKLLGNGLFNKLPSPDLKALIGSMTVAMPASDKTDVAERAVGQLPDKDKSDFVKQTIDKLPDAERRDVASSPSLQAVLPKPDDQTLDFLWKVIVASFCLVLLGTVAALVFSMYRSPVDGGAKPELILAIITTVIGFLAGLVSPSPVQKG
jgi:hypothetical protein